MTLNLVFHVPNLLYNLLSINKLTYDLNCIVKFISSYEFQDLFLGKMIGSAREYDGLYLFNNEFKVCGYVKKKEVIVCNMDGEIMV